MTYASSCHGTRLVLTVVPDLAVKSAEIGGVCIFLSPAAPGVAARLPLGRIGIVSLGLSRGISHANELQ